MDAPDFHSLENEMMTTGEMTYLTNQKVRTFTPEERKAVHIAEMKLWSGEGELERFRDYAKDRLDWDTANPGRTSPEVLADLSLWIECVDEILASEK